MIRYEDVEACLDAMGRFLDEPDVPILVFDATPHQDSFELTIECLWGEFTPRNDAARNLIEAMLRAVVVVYVSGRPLTDEVLIAMRCAAIDVLRRGVKTGLIQREVIDDDQG